MSASRWIMGTALVVAAGAVAADHWVHSRPLPGAPAAMPAQQAAQPSGSPCGAAPCAAAAPCAPAPRAASPCAPAPASGAPASGDGPRFARVGDAAPQADSGPRFSSVGQARPAAPPSAAPCGAAPCGAAPAVPQPAPAAQPADGPRIMTVREAREQGPSRP